MRKNILLFTLFGLISGLLSWHFFEPPEIYNGYLKIILTYAPGWIFGGIISTLLFFTNRKNILLHFLFIGISTLAYYIAFSSFLLFASWQITFAFLVAGLLGSSILTLGLKFMYKIPSIDLVPIIIIGTIAGPIYPSYGIFPIWQTVVAIIIGYVVTEYENKRKSKN